MDEQTMEQFSTQLGKECAITIAIIKLIDFTPNPTMTREAMRIEMASALASMLAADQGKPHPMSTGMREQMDVMLGTD